MSLQRGRLATEYDGTQDIWGGTYGYGNPISITDGDGTQHVVYTDDLGTPWHETYYPDGTYELKTPDNPHMRPPNGSWHTAEPGEEPKGTIRQAQQAEEPSPYGDIQEHLAEDLPGLEPPYVQHHAKGYGLPQDPPAVEHHAKGGLPKLVEEAAPAPPVPGPEVQEHFAKDYGLPGLEEEPPADQYPPADPPVQPNPPEEEPPVEHITKLGVEGTLYDRNDPDIAQDHYLKDYSPDTSKPSFEFAPLHGEIQEHYAKEHDIPDLVDEPAPAPPASGLAFLTDDLEQRQAEERERSEQELTPDPPPPTPGDQVPPVGPGGDREPPPEDRDPQEAMPGTSNEANTQEESNPYGLQEHYARDYNIPDLLEEPAPEPPLPDPEPLVQPTTLEEVMGHQGFTDPSPTQEPDLDVPPDLG